VDLRNTYYSWRKIKGLKMGAMKIKKTKAISSLGAL